MRKLFGQKPKTSKPPPPPNPFPNPVPAEQFTRPYPIPALDDYRLIPQDSTLLAPHEQSWPSALPSLPPATHTPASAGNNHANQTFSPYTDHYSSDRSSNSLLQPSQTPVLKKHPSTGTHNAAAILRSLDPERRSITRSPSPSLESLTLTVETERNPILDYEAEREKVRQREKEREKEFERERRKDKERRSHDKPKDKERKKGIFGTGLREKDKDRLEREVEIIRMIGYLTATASEDWGLVLEVCDRASKNETAARDASRALRREFKYAEPGAQLSAARLWAIMLRNCSEVFISQASSKKFIDTLEEVLLSPATSPVVRERLEEVLAAAAYSHPGHGKDGYRALWNRIKPPNKPEAGIPFDENDAMLNPIPQTLRPSQQHTSLRQRIIPPDEDMRRLFEECEVGKGNAQVLNQSMMFARPEDLGGPLISEWYRKSRNSYDFIMAQIPWATAQADRARAELRLRYLDEHGQETQPIPLSKEEELLAALLGANMELLEAFRIYDDLERLGVAEQEEREVEERSRKEFKLDRTQIQYFAEDGSFQLESTDIISPRGMPGPSRSPSPSPRPSITSLPPLLSTRPLLPPPPAALLDLRSQTPPSNAPSSRHAHSGSLGVDIARLAQMSLEATPDTLEDYGGRTPIVPSAKAMGKRKVVVEGTVDSDDPSNSEELTDGRISPGDDLLDIDDDASQDGHVLHWKKKPIKFAYDAAAERAKEMRRDLGIPAPLTNGKVH